LVAGADLDGVEFCAGWLVSFQSDDPRKRGLIMERRTFLGAVMIAPLAMTGYQRTAPQTVAQNDQAVEDMRRNWKALLAPGADVTLSTEPLRRSEAEWKKRLSPAQFDVLREDGTERAFSSPLDREKRPGIYVCAGCGLPQFTSRMKYDSGTGWPSFITHIPGHVGTRKDYKLILPRTEYHCIRCGGHQGHLFDDGPPPTKQRWCNNGVALRFIPA
jgi:peptide-methionine (R)-S-oxide reductase